MTFFFIDMVVVEMEVREGISVNGRYGLRSRMTSKISQYL